MRTTVRFWLRRQQCSSTAAQHGSAPVELSNSIGAAARKASCLRGEFTMPLSSALIESMSKRDIRTAVKKSDRPIETSCAGFKLLFVRREYAAVQPVQLPYPNGDEYECCVLLRTVFYLFHRKLHSRFGSFQCRGNRRIFNQAAQQRLDARSPR